jgi:hypothetical protein
MLAFRSEAQVDRWCATHGARGALVTFEQAVAMGRVFFGDRRRPDWRRPLPDELRALFESLGLTGPFWALPG